MKTRGTELLDRLESEVLVLDGAMGTMLLEAGLADGACPEARNETHAAVIRRIHQAYFDAGADIVETNTFGGTRLRLARGRLQERARELSFLGARIARSACPVGKYVAGSIGPTGYLPDTFDEAGGVSLDEMRASFAEQALALAEGGVDLLAVETMMVPDEAAIAIAAAKAATGLPVMATMSFQYHPRTQLDRTMWGSAPAEVARLLVEAGADIVGCNCGDGGPTRAAAIIGDMRRAITGTLAAYPNAGMPRFVDGRTTYDLSPDEMAASYPAILEAGASIVGSCCGSTPEHTRCIAAVVRSRRRPRA
jgi:5-methyltetrahydrofolate--homocysteine methyltransferase